MFMGRYGEADRTAAQPGTRGGAPAMLDPVAGV
jgi:hypothetical protein